MVRSSAVTSMTRRESRVVSQNFPVDGQVKTPGIYPLAGRVTLMRAVARAEGLDEFADQNYVFVFRRAGSRDMASLLCNPDRPTRGATAASGLPHALGCNSGAASSVSGV